MGKAKRVNRSVRDVRAKGSELGRTAASRGAEMGRTAANRGRSAASRGAEIGRSMRKLDVPWARCAPARMLRETILQFGLAPLMDLYTRPRVRGRDMFSRVPHPVIFVANHSSHLDTPTIMRALPLQWRQRTAVAAAADYFYKKRGVKELVALIFNTVPLSREGGGVGNGSTAHVDKLIDQRWNILMFPEGTRSRDGAMHKLRSGAAAIAQQHGIPIVPIYVKGTHDAMPPGRNWPKKRWLLARRYRLEVHFGAPIWPRPDEHRSAIMSRVKAFLEAEAGLDAPALPTPAPARVAERSAAPVV